MPHKRRHFIIAIASVALLCHPSRGWAQNETPPPPVAPATDTSSPGGSDIGTTPGAPPADTTVPSQPTAPRSAPWSSQRLQITLTPPDGWISTPEAASDTDMECVFRGPDVDGVPTAMALNKDTAHLAHSLESELENIVKRLQVAMPNARVVSKNVTRYGNDEVARIDLTYVGTKGKAAGKPHTMRHIAIHHAGVLYDFMFACNSSAFTQLATLCEKSLGTIHWSAAIPSQNVVFESLGFSMTTPQGWFLVKPEDPEYIPGAVLIRSPDQPDGFRPNFLLKAISLPGPLTMQELAGSLVSTLRSRPNTVVRGETLVRLDGVNAAVWDNILPSKTPGGPPMYQRLALTVRNGREYIFTFTANKRGFEAGQGAFALFMTSLRWLPSGGGSGTNTGGAQ